MSDTATPSAFKTAPPAAASAPKGSRWMWFIALAVMGLALVVHWPDEVAGWKYVAALEARAAGKKDRAQHLMQELLAQPAPNIIYLFRQYQWDLEDRNYAAALARLEQVIQVETPTAQLLFLRSTLLQHLKRHTEAIDDLRRLDRISESTGKPDRSTTLNGLAYARALAKQELPQALHDIEIVVKTAREDVKVVEQRVQEQQKKNGKATFAAGELLAQVQNSLAACVDTRGFIRLQMGEHTAALADFNEAIEFAERSQAFKQKYQETLSAREHKYADFAEQQKADKHNLGVLYYHRSLAHRQLGDEAKATADFDRARELTGREPDESLF